MNIIKRHPIAFTLLIGWELFSVACLISVAEWADYNWFVIVGLMTGVGALLFIAGIIAWIISAVRRRIKGKITDNTKVFVDNLARQYMVSARAKSVSWIFIMIMLPILPILFVHVLDYYMAGVFFITLGIVVWIVRFSVEIIIDRFYIAKKADDYFSFVSGEDDALLDSFYGDCVHMYRGENWNSSIPEFITSLLKWESALGKNIKCYRVSNEFLRKKYGYDYNGHFDNLILIPISQFDLNEKNGETLIRYFDRLSAMQFTDFVNLKYQHKSSLEPSDYAFTEESLRLDPAVGRAVDVSESGGNVCMVIDTAYEENCPWKKYYNCLAVMKNAVMIEGESLDSNMYIESFRINKNDNELQITVSTVPNFDSDIESDEEFFDGITKTLRYRFESLQWHWDGFCDCSKMVEILERITVKSE